MTTGWFRRLLRARPDAAAIGLAGPCSNRVERSPAGSGRRATTSLAGLDGFAWDWGKAITTGYVSETDRLVGLLPADPPRGRRPSGSSTSGSASVASRTTTTACGRSRRATGRSSATPRSITTIGRRRGERGRLHRAHAQPSAVPGQVDGGAGQTVRVAHATTTTVIILARSVSEDSGGCPLADASG